MDANANAPRHPKRLRALEEDDIVRYAPDLDLPIVGLVRDKDEYREFREIALISGVGRGLAEAKGARKE